MESEILFALGEQFLTLDGNEPALFYIWGHSYELDLYDCWEQMEKFLAMISGKEDIFYGTNREILLQA